MRKPYPREFIKAYAHAFRTYVKGDWALAKTQFEAVLEMRPEDIVTTNLMNFMNETKYVKPPDWKGYKFFNE